MVPKVKERCGGTLKNYEMGKAGKGIFLNYAGSVEKIIARALWMSVACQPRPIQILFAVFEARPPT